MTTLKQSWRLSPAVAMLLQLAGAPLASAQDHLVVGQGPPGGPRYRLFGSGSLVGASGHGPSVAPGAIIPLLRINPSSTYAQPRFGGYSFSTTGGSGLGLDYSASPNDLSLSNAPPGTSEFTVSMLRLSCSRPGEFAIYTPFGAPRMVEDMQAYAFGDQNNGGHVHPLFFSRRPGQSTWHMKWTSDVWLESEAYAYTFTTVPGRASVVTLNMSGLFNADVVDSDANDNPAPFDAAGHSWLLNGHHGTTSGLPVDGRVNEFQLGGPAATGMFGSNLNALFDDGVLSMAGTLDLQATGQADQYLGIELLIGASGTLSTSDVVTVTLTYSDNTTRIVQIRQGTADWTPYRPIDHWQQSALPRPWTAVGRTGDRSLGFARSTGSSVDTAAGENTVFFRACTPADSTRTLTRIAVSDYAGSNRVAIFAMIGLRKAPLAIVTTMLPPAVEGQPYFASIAAEGTPPFRNWAAAGLPSGLMMDTDTGIITGTPGAGAAAGSPYAITIGVDDSIHLHDAAFAPESAVAMLSMVFASVPGDINADGVVNEADRALFVRVLLELETDPSRVQRCDMDGSGTADGDDARLMMSALMP